MGFRRSSSLQYLLIAIGCLWASAASAVSVSLAGISSSSGSNPIAIGDFITLDLLFANALAPVVGVSIQAYDYDPTVLSFASGEATLSIFNKKIIGGEPSGGLFNSAPTRAGFPSGSMSLSDTPGCNAVCIEIFEGVSLVSSSGDGSLDNGVSGNPVSGGDVHARLVFQLIGVGPTTIRFDNGSGIVVFEDASTGPVSGFSVQIFEGAIVPEPGTAFFLGLGLASLAIRPRT